VVYRAVMHMHHNDGDALQRCLFNIVGASHMQVPEA
jgi:hypothetical protein